MKTLRFHCLRGFVLIELLLVLVILGTLSGMALAPSSATGGKTASVYYIERTQRVACEANRGSLAIHVADYQINQGRAPSIADLEAARISIPRCPEGGRFYILDGQIYCTLHTPVALPSLEYAAAATAPFQKP